MIRLLPWIILIVAMAVGVAWLADHPSTITIELPGYRVEMASFVVVGAAVVLFGAFAFFYRLWHFLRRGHPQRRAMARQERGYEELTRGLAALMAGEAPRARRLARKSQQLLGDVPMAQLIEGQAAQLTGDTAGARVEFQALSEDKRTNVMGLRGLISVAEREGDASGALVAAREALSRYPKARWAQQKLYALAVEAKAWEDAEVALNAAVKNHGLNPAEARRQRAVILYERARETDARGEAASALPIVRKALQQDPSLIPARVLGVKLLGASGKRRRAEKLLKEGWAAGPHPDLVDAWDSLDPDASPTARYKRLEKLIESAPAHAEAFFALSKYALAADLPGPARGHTEKLIETAPTAHAYRLLANIEDQAGNEEAAEAATVKASVAPADKGWSCGQCGHADEAWRSECPACGGFGAFAWGAPDVPLPKKPARVEPDVEILPPD